MIDLMLDIETLGRGPGCIVPQAAIVPFHLDGPILSDEETNKFTFETKLHIGEQLALGYVIDEETYKWWMSQKAEIRIEVFSGTITVSTFKELLEQYLAKVKVEYGDYCIWASAPKLDYGCLSSILAPPGGEYPVSYRAERDVRTLKDTVTRLKPNFKWPRTLYNHNAIVDCKSQIVTARAGFGYLKYLEMINGAKQTTTTSSDVHADVRPGNTDGTLHPVKGDNGSEDQTITGGVG